MVIRLARLAACASLVALATGCAYTLALESEPSAASVRLPSGRTVVTPEEVRFWWVPLGRFHDIAPTPVEVSAPGYRTLTVDLQDRQLRGSRVLTDPVFRPLRALGVKPRGEVTFLLVPAHGPSGTWDPRQEGLE